MSTQESLETPLLQQPHKPPLIALGYAAIVLVVSFRFVTVVEG